MTCAVVFNVAGLMANLAGVILLFRYGMPFRVPSKGRIVRVLSGPPNQDEIKEDRHHARLGLLGLGLIILGTFAQIVGAIIA
jgi:hypothetical protein